METRRIYNETYFILLLSILSYIFQSGDRERMIGYSRSRSIQKVLTPNCGHVGATNNFTCSNIVFASYVMFCLIVC